MNESPPPADAPPRKLLSSLPVKLRIGAACIALLLMGAWLRPRTAAPLASPEERPAPLLEAQVQRAAPNIGGIEAAVAGLPARGIVVQQPDSATAAVTRDFRGGAAPGRRVFAVAVSDSYAVTHATALAGGPPLITTADGTQLPTSIAAFDPATELVLLNLPSPAAPLPTFADTVPPLGALVVGAARSTTVDVAVPLFITSVAADRYGIGGGADAAPAGLPIYDLGGGLLAVSVGDGFAWRIRHALDRLLSQAATKTLPSSIGLAFQEVDETLAASIESPGLAIVDVAAGGPGDVAGIAIGDVIVGVGSASAASSGELAAALAALPAGAPVSLSLRRGRRAAAVTVTPVFAHEMAALDSGPSRSAAPRAHTLFTAEALAAAAVPPDAAVLLINGRAVGSPDRAARELRQIKGATLVLLEHRGRRFFTAIDITR